MEPVMQAAETKQPLFAKKVIPIVPYSVKGRYRNLKTLVLAVAYGVFFSLPWLTWHGTQRTGQPILIDLATLRVNFLDLVIFPHDLILVVGLLILGVVLLFMAASLYGRVFCGFFCIQTVWTDAFRMIERAVQGEAQARLRLRKQPWTPEKMLKFGTTHALWLLLAFASALTFTLYFLEAPLLFARFFDGTAPTAAYIAVAALTATTYVAAGLAREDVCRVACPYGKFQTAMQDANTLTVVYDSARGERTQGRTSPRAELKQPGSREQQGVGDCISCNYCVNVCPTGVDIRKGFQLDCISCGLCVDACNTIMDSVQLPRGLIRFEQGQTTQQGRRRFNTKALGYSGVMAAMLGFVIYTANTLEPFDATVQHHAQPLVTRLSNGDLKNRYIVRITNKTTEKAHYVLRVEGVPQDAVGGATELQIPAGKTYTQTFSVVLPEKTALNTDKLRLILQQQGPASASKSFNLSYYTGA
jgi:cytochrome c oxidase accessory protein FixG